MAGKKKKGIPRKATWKNRIVGHGKVSPDKLKDNPLNWRVHPESQEKAMGQVLDEVGFVDDVIINKRTGLIVDGHLRVELARKRGEKTVPVKYVDLSEKEEKLVLAVFDPIGAMATTNQDALAGIVADVGGDHKEALDSILTKKPVSFDDPITFDDPIGKQTITITVGEHEAERFKSEVQTLTAGYETVNVHF